MTSPQIHPVWFLIPHHFDGPSFAHTCEVEWICWELTKSLSLSLFSSGSEMVETFQVEMEEMERWSRVKKSKLNHILGGIFLWPAVSSRSKSRRCRWSHGIRRQPPCTSVCVGPKDSIFGVGKIGPVVFGLFFSNWFCWYGFLGWVWYGVYEMIQVKPWLLPTNIF